MRHQERNVSEFDEIITYPPSAAPSGEKQVMSCVQAFTAALGFAMSAGWDWLPSMHRLWLRDYIEAVSMPTPFGFFGTLSGSIFFKMIMLLALCPVMERIFHAFPLDRVAFRRKPFPNADYALLPPALRERIYLSTPLILSQLCAILLLLVLTFSFANACSRLGSRASSCAGFCCAAFPIWIFSPSREASIWFFACSQLCMVFRFYLIFPLVVRWFPST